MKKTFYFQTPNKSPERQIESIRHEINKYLSREKRKPVPKNSDYWGFECRIGESDENSSSIHVEEISKSITELSGRGICSFYLEILAKPKKRSKKMKLGKTNAKV